MFKKLITSVVILVMVLFLAGCNGSDDSKKDQMRNWGTKKSTATPMKDLP
jgi:uncharacterized lipoprotein YehR (DUF1307 family)